MASIHFFVEQIKFSLQQKRQIRQWIQQAILDEKKIPGEINYIFCPDEYLLNINKSFLDHNTLTDIITFQTEPVSGPTTNKKRNSSSINGEIYISIDRVKENAKKFDPDFSNELRRVMIHGVLHLCGYTDKSPLEAKKMRAREDLYLGRFPVK